MSKINYDLKLIKAMVFEVDGVLSPSTVPLHIDGTPLRMANVKDGYALQLALKHDFKIAIITGGFLEIVKKRFDIIGIKDVFMGASMKLDILKNWMVKEGLQPEQVAYAGDDMPDYECMNYVGLSVAPRDACVEIRSIARYISPVNGGYGVARDIIEEIMKAQGLWMHPLNAFKW